ncbi:MAG: hypothetical protein Q9195_004846 [Heterodermia aff. obscurata]
MAPFRSMDDVFEVIARDLREVRKADSHNSVEAGISFVTEQLKKYNHLPFMQGVDVLDYYQWSPKEYVELAAREDQAALEAKRTTAQELLQAAYEFNPSITGTDPNDTKLVKLTVTNCVPSFPIGKIYGETPVWLKVAPGPLLPSEIKTKYFTTLPTAITDAGAISYPDCHPSEADAEGSSEGRPKEVLSRFWPLGYLSYRRSAGYFERTGHVLVMDMERGRDHHPWIVLASEWRDINGDGDDGLGFFHAPSRVELDTPGVHGIFPGDTRRTPVAKLVHKGDHSASELPFLKQLGPDLLIDLWRKGGVRPYERTTRFRSYHPDLARIMSWYWDAVTREEVCYDEDGQEYSRYNTISGKFRTLNPDAVSLEGSIAMFGEIIRSTIASPMQPQENVPLFMRVDPATLRQAPDVQTGSGF